MSRRVPRVETVSRESLERIAGIVGPSSAAALILADAAEKFGKGAQFWRVDNAFVAGPAGAPPPIPRLPCHRGERLMNEDRALDIFLFHAAVTGEWWFAETDLGDCVVRGEGHSRSAALIDLASVLSVTIGRRETETNASEA